MQQGRLSFSWPSVSLSDGSDPSSPTDVRSQGTRPGQGGARPRPAHADLHSGPRKCPASARPALSLRPKASPTSPRPHVEDSRLCSLARQMLAHILCAQVAWPPAGWAPPGGTSSAPRDSGPQPDTARQPSSPPPVTGSDTLASSNMPGVPSALLPPLSHPRPAHTIPLCPRSLPPRCGQSRLFRGQVRLLSLISWADAHMARVTASSPPSPLRALGLDSALQGRSPRDEGQHPLLPPGQPAVCGPSLAFPTLGSVSRALSLVPPPPSRLLPPLSPAACPPHSGRSPVSTRPDESRGCGQGEPCGRQLLPHAVSSRLAPLLPPK